MHQVVEIEESVFIQRGYLVVIQANGLHNLSTLEDPRSQILNSLIDNMDGQQIIGKQKVAILGRCHFCISLQNAYMRKLWKMLKYVEWQVAGYGAHEHQSGDLKGNSFYGLVTKQS